MRRAMDPSTAGQSSRSDDRLSRTLRPARTALCRHHSRHANADSRRPQRAASRRSARTAPAPQQRHRTPMRAHGGDAWHLPCHPMPPSPRHRLRAGPRPTAAPGRLRSPCSCSLPPLHDGFVRRHDAQQLIYRDFSPLRHCLPIRLVMIRVPDAPLCLWQPRSQTGNRRIVWDRAFRPLFGAGKTVTQNRPALAWLLARPTPGRSVRRPAPRVVADSCESF